MREQSKKQSLQIQTGVKQKISSLLSFCSKGPDVSWCLWAPLGRTELAWLGSEKGAPAFLGFWQCLWPLGSPWFPPCYQCLIRHHLTHRKTKRNLGEEGGFQLQWENQSHEGSQNMGQSWETFDWQPCLGMKQHLLGVHSSKGCWMFQIPVAGQTSWSSLFPKVWMIGCGKDSIAIYWHLCLKQFVK